MTSRYPGSGEHDVGNITMRFGISISRLLRATSASAVLGVTTSFVLLAAGPPAGHYSGSHSGFTSSPVIRPLGIGSTGNFSHPIVAPLIQAPPSVRSGYSGTRSGYWNGTRNGGRLPSRRPGTRGYANPFYPVFLYGGSFYGSPAYDEGGTYYDQPQQQLQPDPAGVGIPYDGSEEPAYAAPLASPYPPPYYPGPYSEMGGPQASPQQQETAPSAPVVTEPPITIVLRSGQKLRVDNYAVTNGVLWDFSKTPIRKIPVSSIDISASAQATEASGTDFPDLSSTGQSN